jgi:glycerophosphoryl diester phosphodiesterase
MLRGGVPHQRRFPFKRQRSARAKFIPGLSFRNFLCMVLGLVALAFTPSLYQRFFQTAIKTDCEWLKNPPMICAHGGDSSRAFPNTNAAYQLALDAGVDCIEIDASRTWDGVLVALHDRDLQQMSEKSGIRVGDLTANEISKLDPTKHLGGGFPKQHVPTVEEAIQYVQRSLKQIIIDAKVGPPRFDERLSADLISLVKRTDCKACLVWTKEDKVIREILHQSVNTKTGYVVTNNSYDSKTQKMSQFLRFEGADVVGVYYGLITSALVKFFHRAGKRVHAWTVNSSDAMIEMLKAGVDAIITNDPKLLQLVMQDEKQLCMLNGFAAF